MTVLIPASGGDTSAEHSEYRCNEAEARELTDSIKEGVEKTYRRLLQAHRWRAWSALGYASWRDYAQTEFGIGQSRAYQLLDQARVVEEIEQAVSTKVEISEREVRGLKPHLPAVIDAVKSATADVPDDEKPAAAAEAIRAARAHVTTTTRTTEATKVEQDVDLDTGEVLSDEPGQVTKLTGHASVSDPTPEPDPVEDFLVGQHAVAAQMLRANVRRALIAANHLPDHDVANVAAAVDDDFMDDLAAVLHRINTWADAVRSARPRGLRVVGSGK